MDHQGWVHSEELEYYFFEGQHINRIRKKPIVAGDNQLMRTLRALFEFVKQGSICLSEYQDRFFQAVHA